MPLSKKQQGEQTRAALLAAAEALFAEHGFEGARVDDIAERAGHNKALIFRYFGNKLGLYAAVLQRADVEFGALLKRLFVPLLADPALTTEAGRFRSFLEATFGTIFDYMVAHPQFTRMINWEQAAAWRTFAGLASQFEPAEFAQLSGLFRQAQAAGLLRPDLDAVQAVLLAQQLCWSAPNSLPLYQLFRAGRRVSKARALAHLRAQVIALSVNGMLLDPLRARKG